MNEDLEAIRSINTEKILSIIFILIGVFNIYGDNLLIKSIMNGNENEEARASQIFLFGLIVSFILYIFIVSRNYRFYTEKKASGEDATNELTRFYGSVLVLIGFGMIFYYFLQSDISTDNPPVL